MDKFLFLGFPPMKNKRKKFFETVARNNVSVVFYESPYRILKTLGELKTALFENGIVDLEIVVCRELTKKFETISRGTMEEIIDEIKKSPIKGEFVVILGRVNKSDYR